jgi:hypothetical protein
MDFRGVTFRACLLSNCEWINCHFDESTEFVNCTFTGRFRQSQSYGLRRTVFNPINELNTDMEARNDLVLLLQNQKLVTVSSESAIGTLTAILEMFRGTGFFVPRTRELIAARFVAAPLIRDYIMERLVANNVVEEIEGRGLQIVKKNSMVVAALLDNGTLSNPLSKVVAEVLKHFGRVAG